jgi:D-serine deaminase-like pyridoxal phosphate-dependent protein
MTRPVDDIDAAPAPVYTLAAMRLTKSDLSTPALLLDLELFEANIHHMQKTVSGAGKALRPHAKAHKCVEIARRQVAAGAAGVCVATLAEMELMSGAGIGVLLTTPVASAVKTDRIAALSRSGADLRVVVDHPIQVRLYQESAARAGTRLPVLVDLDVGDHRTGIPCDERAVALARIVSAAPNLRFAGLQAYSVSASHTEGHQTRRAHSARAIAQAIPVRQELLGLGLDASTLTGGSTGTWDIDTAIPEMTEIQAGSYPLMDVAYRRIGSIPFAPAMTILATVVSASHPDRVTVDAGFKAFATDRPFGPEPVGLPEARWQWAGDEHGVLEFEGAGAKLQPGSRIEFLAPHCDPTVNLHDRIHVCRGDQVVEVWPLKRLALEPAAAGRPPL